LSHKSFKTLTLTQTLTLTSTLTLTLTLILSPKPYTTISREFYSVARTLYLIRQVVTAVFHFDRSDNRLFNRLPSNSHCV